MSSFGWHARFASLAKTCPLPDDDEFELDRIYRINRIDFCPRSQAGGPDSRFSNALSSGSLLCSSRGHADGAAMQSRGCKVGAATIIENRNSRIWFRAWERIPLILSSSNPAPLRVTPNKPRLWLLRQNANELERMPIGIAKIDLR